MKAKVKELYLAGLSCKAISTETGINVNAVYKIVKTAGIARSRTESLQKYVAFGNCVICGRKFRMREKWTSTTSHHRKTCSDDCEEKFRSIRQKEVWENSPERREYMSNLLKGRDTTGWNIARRERAGNWKGGASPSVYREIAKEAGLAWICSVCGSEENICVHHIDKNRANNNPENLLIKCKSCHTSKHSKDGDCGWAVYNRKKYSGIS